MDHSIATTYLVHRTFADVDDLAAEAKQWDLDFRQLDRGKFRGELLQFGSGGVHIADARFRRVLRQKGAPPAGMRTVAIPAVRDLRLEWRGKAVDGNSLLVFPQGADLSSVSGPDFHVYTCSFPEHLLAMAGALLEVGDLDDVVKGADAIRIGPRASQNLRRLLARVCQSVSETPQELSNESVVTRLTDELPARVIAAVSEGRGHCPAVSGSKRIAAVTRAEAYIEQYASDSIGIPDICRAAGVSERTLRYAFLERFGIGPKDFLTAFRLNAVRRELRSSDPTRTKVSDVANGWGYWHMGQFAADYRKRFAELPSETLQRSSP